MGERRAVLDGRLQSKVRNNTYHLGRHAFGAHEGCVSGPGYLALDEISVQNAHAQDLRCIQHVTPARVCFMTLKLSAVGRPLGIHGGGPKPWACLDNRTTVTKMLAEE